jgi:hypothetical protein
VAREDGLAMGKNTQFSSTNQPANPGRKPSKLKKWIKENGVSNEDFIAVFKNLIASRTIEELQDMVKGDNKNKLPVVVALCVSAFLHDMENGTLTAANTILDRIMGKPQIKTEITASVSVKSALEDWRKTIEAVENGSGTPD